MTFEQVLRGRLIEGLTMKLETEAVRTFGVDLAPLVVASYPWAPDKTRSAT